MATSRIDGRAILAGLTSLALIGSLFLVLRAPAALAEEQHNNEYPSVPCGTGDTRDEAWHWVHNQVPDGVTTATLTASFEILTGPNAGTTTQFEVVGEIGPAVIHYDLYYPYGLKLLPTPSDNVDGGMLLLSHWPECSDNTTTSSTTSTTDPYVTTTTDPYVTTTTQGTTTTSIQSTSTSTTQASTTSTTDPYTTTTNPTTTSTTEATTTSTTEATTTSTTEATTTSTTEASTTTTTEATTTTTLPDEVDDSEVTTTTEPDEVSPTVLPFTGIDSDSIFLIALILISTGVLTVVFMRGTKEWGES